MKTLRKTLLMLAVAISAVACKAPEAQGPKLAVILYTVRNEMAADFKGTLEKVKEIGYEGVEFAGLFGNDPAQVKAWCEEIGLKPISAHVALSEMRADIDKVISDYKTIGCEYIVVPYLETADRPGTENFENTLADIKAFAEKAKAAGLKMLYHNHDFEFVEMPDGTFGLDYMYNTIPADLLGAELDLCWVKYAGQDPCEYIAKYADRENVVHMKDYYATAKVEGDPYALIGQDEGGVEESPETAFEFRPVGMGLQSVSDILKAVKDTDIEWIIVEQDEPSMGLSPLECAELSYKVLEMVLESGEDVQVEIGCCDGDCDCEDCQHNHEKTE